MRRFDICRNANPDSVDSVPYLLVIQSDFLESLDTRIVVPLLPARGHPPRIAQLNPVFEIEGESHVASFAEMAGVPRGVLGKPVTSVPDRSHEITAALDFLIHGF